MRTASRLRLLITPWLAAAVCAAPALANPYETRLDNGLRVIVKEDRRAPTAVHMVWYRIGSMDEVDGTSGVAHVLEHMMFKGTPTVGPGEFNKRVAAAGGRDNAFTSRDYTAYFQQIPREKLGEMMALEADRMRHLNVDASEFAAAGGVGRTVTLVDRNGVQTGGSYLAEIPSENIVVFPKGSKIIQTPTAIQIRILHDCTVLTIR